MFSRNRGVVWAACALLAAAAVRGAEWCGAGPRAGADALRVWLSSEVNVTGHWAAALRLERAGRAGRAGRRLELHAEPSSWRCGVVTTHALQLTLQGPPPARPPPEGYEEAAGDEGWHKVHAAPTTWEAAAAACEAEGAHLLVLNSDAEAAAVKALVARHTGLTKHLLVGFHSKDAPKSYVTVFGQPLVEAGYARWSTNEPSSPDVEKCGSITPSAFLNDIQCTNPKSFICEYEY